MSGLFIGVQCLVLTFCCAVGTGIVPHLVKAIYGRVSRSVYE